MGHTQLTQPSLTRSATSGLRCSRMDEDEIAEIVSEICELLDRQVQAISGKGKTGLSADELGNYERRKEQIARLRSKLAHFERPN